MWVYEAFYQCKKNTHHVNERYVNEDASGDRKDPKARISNVTEWNTDQHADETKDRREHVVEDCLPYGHARFQKYCKVTWSGKKLSFQRYRFRNSVHNKKALFKVASYLFNSERFFRVCQLQLANQVSLPAFPKQLLKRFYQYTCCKKSSHNRFNTFSLIIENDK